MSSAWNCHLGPKIFSGRFLFLILCLKKKTVFLKPVHFERVDGDQSMELTKKPALSSIQICSILSIWPHLLKRVTSTIHLINNYSADNFRFSILMILTVVSATWSVSESLNLKINESKFFTWMMQRNSLLLNLATLHWLEISFLLSSTCLLSLPL